MDIKKKTVYLLARECSFCEDLLCICSFSGQPSVSDIRDVGMLVVSGLCIPFRIMYYSFY